MALLGRLKIDCLRKRHRSSERTMRRRIGDINPENILAGIVDGDVLVRLEKTHLADAFRADAAGREVGDAARLKFDADVGDIDLRRKDRQPDRVEFADGRLNKPENHVEIVNHQIENYVHIERAWSKYTEPMNLKKQRPMHDGADGAHSRIEAFEMADLQNSVVAFGYLDEIVRLFECVGYWLFEQDIDACREELSRRLEVQ